MQPIHYSTHTYSGIPFKETWEKKHALERKVQHSENEDHGIRFHHFMGNRWGNSGNSVRLYFSGLQKNLTTKNLKKEPQ